MARIIVFGGTGTLGRAFLKSITDSELASYEIVVVSRDEHKQQELKRQYPWVTFRIGDIRDRASIEPFFVYTNVKYVFHFAALKHIDVCEYNPMESIRTNVLGSNNIAELCIKYSVKRCVFSSTDKAVDPISVYGYSKAMVENMFLNYNQNQTMMTRFIVYRWPNVTASNGSFISFAIDKMIMGESIPLTDPGMSRFWIKIESALEFVLSTFQYDQGSKVLIPPFVKSALVTEILDAISEILGIDYKTHVVGIRGIEKMSECLISKHSVEHVDSAMERTRFSKAELIDFFSPIVVNILKQKEAR